MEHQLLGFILCACFLPIFHTVPEKEAIEAICSANTCYTAHLDNKTFSDAQNECTSRRGNLLTILSEEEEGHVHTLLGKFTTTIRVTVPLKLWIGLWLKSKSCVVKDQPLKGFSWITDEKEDRFSNWLTVPKQTCTKERCVSMTLHMESPNNYKWTDELCSSRAHGFICKYNLYGMCRGVALVGPGFVEYETPFRYKSSSLDLVPFGTMAIVSCRHNREYTDLVCHMTETNVYEWVNPDSLEKPNGPLCASEEPDCKYNNGGCEHECVEDPQNRSRSCRCRDSYVLAPDRVSCVSPDHCQSNPCAHICTNQRHGFQCSCSSGFVLAENQVDCKNIEGCAKGDCDPRISAGSKDEEMESEYNNTSTHNPREHEPQTTTRSLINEGRDKGKSHQMTQPGRIPSLKTAPPTGSPANNAADCNTSKLLLSILCVSVVFYS